VAGQGSGSDNTAGLPPPQSAWFGTDLPDSRQFGNGANNGATARAIRVRSTRYWRVGFTGPAHQDGVIFTAHDRHQASYGRAALRPVHRAMPALAVGLHWPWLSGAPVRQAACECVRAPDRPSGASLTAAT